MMKNTKITFGIFLIIFLILSINSIYATPENFTDVKTTDDIYHNDDFSQISSLMKNTEDNTEKDNNIILDTKTFNNYVTDGKFNDNVTSGDTIDIQGKLDSSKFSFEITKPVNIISSTGEGYVDFNTVRSGEIFKISKEGIGTNISGITIHNTRLSLENTSNIIINNITFLDEGANIGFGVGAVSIREGSENITITNSYFKTQGNGGHSNVVFAAAYNCLFENNTIEGYGDQGLIGNLLYLTTYNVKYATPATNINITIRNNTIRSYYTYGYGTCYGLALEGTGHIIENNIIDTAIPVRAQYADKDYDFETYMGSIYFNNNTITHSDYNNYGSEGYPAELTFSGIVANNTFINHGATLKQVFAYNNTFYTVTITNNTKFENNTAKSIIISGNNNTLNNNEVYSISEYAITVSGENNALTNNKLASSVGNGENSISNSSEIISLNNSALDNPKVYYITDDNINDYFMDISSMIGVPGYAIIGGTFKDNDIWIFNLSDKTSPIILYDAIIPDSAVEIVIENTTSYNLMPALSKSITFKNSHIMQAQIQGNGVMTLINSTILTGNNLILDENSYDISTFPKDGIYILTSIKQDVFEKNSGHVLDSIDRGSKILFYEYNIEYSDFLNMFGISEYINDIYIDKSLNLLSIGDSSNIASNIHFIGDSDGTNITGGLFTGNIIFETDNINFFNCTFNNDLVINQSFIFFEGCKFNGKVTLNSSNNAVLNNCSFNSTDTINIVNTRNTLFENNTVTTTADNTIVFDDDSYNNVVRNNNLLASSLVGDDSVVAGDNDVYDNTPGYDTQIVIDCDSQAYVDDDFEVTITVNDLNNSKPVSKGYIELYYDGYLIDIKDLTDGSTSVTIPIVEYLDGSDSYPIKVWYYDGKRYNNNITTKSVRVVKSNVSISLDEFTAKLNEKATVTAIFLNQNGNHVGDTNVTFTVGRSSYTAQTDNGVATINELVTSEWLDAGKITVTFPNTDAYNSNTTTISLNTSKADIHITPSVTVEGSTANINVALTDELNSNVTDGRVTITTLDGTQLASGRVSNGVYTATVTIPDDYASEYLVANFTGSYYYNDLVRNIKLSGMLNSTITIETNSPVYGEELIITGKLVDSRNNAIKDTNITVNINGVKEVISTDADGNYTYSILPELGVNTITVSFDGNIDVYATSETRDITIRDTDHDMNEVLNQLDELTAENARLQEQLDNLTQLSNDLKEQLANQTGELSEQNAALQQQIDTLTTIIAALTDIINSQNEQIAALTAPENTTIIFNDVVDVRYKSDVVISGILTSQKGMALSGQTVTLTIGDKSVDVTTKNGEFEYTTVFKSVGEQTITASYAGNDNYLNSEAALTFDVAKQDVVVTVDPIADSAYGDNVTITGKFSDVDGKAISNSNVRVFVNGKKFLAKTDKTGTYTLSVKVNAVGENNVTVAYAGNDNYNSYEDTTTFNADKQDVVVTGTVINIPKVGENVTITGTFTDKNGKAIINSNVKITINGKKYYARTDSTGLYTFTTTVTSAGINNVTVGYSGNDKYNSYEDVTTFNVGAQDVIVTVNPIEETVVGENVTISGTFTDKYGKAIVNSNVKILFNGKKYYARTDSTGTYTFTTTVTTEGINNITVGYAGSAKYNAYETSTTFIAKAE